MNKYYRFLVLAVMAISYYLLPLNSVNASATAPHAPVAAAEEKKGSEHKKYLVVDDAVLDLKMKKSLMKRAGIDEAQIDVATDAITAIAKIDTTQYALILTDGNMGGTGKDADALLAHLRNSGGWKASVPVILETANVDEWKGKLKDTGNLTIIAKGNAALAITEIKKHL